MGCNVYWQHKGLGRPSRRLRASSRKLHASRLSLVEPLEPRLFLAADPIIAEFQALNTSTFADQDGDYSDWIEIRNPDSAAINLDGWYLTDDNTDLRKWKFPSVTIAAGDELLVFASGKDRADAAGQLHTNFRLSGDGEYLGLIKPDGITVAHDFGDSYPVQVEDTSYGVALGRRTVELATETSVVKALVPASDALGLNWTQVGFDDAGWPSGHQGVGYEVLKPGTTVREEFDATLGPEWTTDIPQGAFTLSSIDGGRLQLFVPANQDTSSTARGFAPIVHRAARGWAHGLGGRHASSAADGRPRGCGHCRAGRSDRFTRTAV